MNPIIEMSLLEDDISSHINLNPQELQYEKKGDYNVPERYDVNRFVILPVNPNLIYSYWFTEDNLKRRISERYPEFNIVIKIFVESSLIDEINIDKLEGQEYINCYAPFKKVQFILGIKHKTDFEPILYSNHITMPSDTIFLEEDQHWYNRKDGIVRVKKIDVDYLEDIKMLAKDKNINFTGYYYGYGDKKGNL